MSYGQGGGLEGSSILKAAMGPMVGMTVSVPAVGTT